MNSIENHIGFLIFHVFLTDISKRLCNVSYSSAILTRNMVSIFLLWLVFRSVGDKYIIKIPKVLEDNKNHIRFLIEI